MLTDQDRAVRLFKDRMPEAAENLLHARAHREVIRHFGRFRPATPIWAGSRPRTSRPIWPPAAIRTIVDSLRQAS